MRFALRPERGRGWMVVHSHWITVLSSLWWALGKWTPQLTRNRSDRLLRLLTLKLYGASRGDVFHACIQASQEGLAHELGLSREWTNKLLARLAAAGWVHTYA